MIGLNDFERDGDEFYDNDPDSWALIPEFNKTPSSVDFKGFKYPLFGRGVRPEVSRSIFEMMKHIKKQMTIRSVVRFSGHTLRHTYAHMAMRNGMDIYTLSMNMGHSSVVMTQKYLQTLKSDDFVEKSVQYSTLKNLR